MANTDHTSSNPACPEFEHSLAGRIALITGASSGIGRAIAIALARVGAHLYLVGRDQIRLAETTAAAREYSRVRDHQIDLTVENDLQPLLSQLERECDGLDILIHCAGTIALNPMERACVDDLDLQYAINVRAPYVLTQRLLPLLQAARGQIVFVNSSLGLAASRSDAGQYSATKHALKAIADSLRAEVNPSGIRVLTVYLGRVATPMQAALYKQQGKLYEPEGLLQPEDIASLVVHTLMLPHTAEVTDIAVRPMLKSY